MNEMAISQPLTSPDTPNPIDNLKEHITQHVVKIGGRETYEKLTRNNVFEENFNII